MPAEKRVSGLPFGAATVSGMHRIADLLTAYD
jgi:hypothetical protein